MGHSVLNHHIYVKWFFTYLCGRALEKRASWSFRISLFPSDCCSKSKWFLCTNCKTIPIVRKTKLFILLFRYFVIFFNCPYFLRALWKITTSTSLLVHIPSTLLPPMFPLFIHSIFFNYYFYIYPHIVNTQPCDLI